MKSIVCLVTAISLGFATPALATEVQVRAGVVKGDGDVKPVARQPFVAYPWNPVTFSAEVMGDPSVGTPPDPKAYIGEESDFLSVYQRIKPEFYADYEAWKQRFDMAIAARKAALGAPVEFKTDLSGAATVELPNGRYYLFGHYADSFADMYWSAPLTVTPKTKVFELSNDNSLDADPQWASAANAGVYRNIIENGGYVAVPLTMPELEQWASPTAYLAMGGAVVALIGLFIYAGATAK